MSAGSKEVGGLGRESGGPVRSERDPCWDLRRFLQQGSKSIGFFSG